MFFMQDNFASGASKRHKLSVQVIATQHRAPYPPSDNDEQDGLNKTSFKVSLTSCEESETLYTSPGLALCCQVDTIYLTRVSSLLSSRHYIPH